MRGRLSDEGRGEHDSLLGGYAPGRRIHLWIRTGLTRSRPCRRSLERFERGVGSKWGKQLADDEQVELDAGLGRDSHVAETSWM